MSEIRSEEGRKKERALFSGTPTRILEIDEKKGRKIVRLDKECSVFAFFDIYNQLVRSKNCPKEIKAHVDEGFFLLNIEDQYGENLDVAKTMLREGEIPFFTLSPCSMNATCFLFLNSDKKSVLPLFQELKKRFHPYFLSPNEYVNFKNELER